MKQAISKITSFLLAFLVLFSTFSFTVEEHYCGDFLMDVSLMDISLMSDVDNCEMEMQEATVKKSCCSDEVHQVEGQDELQLNKVQKITFEHEQFLTAFVFSYKELLIEDNSKNKYYSDSSPPDISLNYQVLYQTFLI